MPSIPQYNTRQVKTDAAATPYYKTQASAEAFGAGTAKALQGLGEKMGDASSAVGKILIAKADAKKEAEEKASDAAEKQVNETLAVDYSNQFIQATQPLLDHYFGQRGKGAVGGYDAAASQLTQAKEDLLSQAPGPGVADMLSPALDGELNASLSQLQRHRDQQQGVYEDDVSAMRIGLSREKANRAYNDDRAVATNFHIAASEQAHQLQRRGASPEEQATARANLASSFLRGRIESALGNNDLLAAQRYYAAAGAGLNAADQAPVKARLEAAVLTDTVQRHTQQILQAPAPMPSAAPTTVPAGGEAGIAVPDGPRPPDLQTRLAEVVKIADPAVRDRVEVNVALATEREAAAYRDNQRQLKAQAKQILDQGGDLGAIPYDTMSGMDQAGRAAFTAYAKAGGRVASDPVVFYRLQNQALDHPQVFLDADLYDHLGELDAKDFAALSQLQDKLRKGQTSGEDDPQFSLLRSYKANTDRVLAQLGLPGGEGSEASEDDTAALQQVAAFRRNVETDLSAYEAATGRKATPAEQQKIVDQAAINLRASARHYAMTRFGGIVQLPGGATDGVLGKDNARLIKATDDDLVSDDHGSGQTTNTAVNQYSSDARPGNMNHSGRASSDSQLVSSPNHRRRNNKPLSDQNDQIEAPTFTFNLNSESMSALQDGNRASYPAFSGLPGAENDPSKTAQKDIGPLPKGTYYIVDRQSGGRLGWLYGLLRGGAKDDWFALYRVDDSIDDETTIDGVQRGQFRLHPIGPRGISEGCITIKNEDDYNKIRDQLLSSKKRLIPGTNIPYYGSILVK